jgi:putative solute:sodium symporter small subunit
VPAAPSPYRILKLTERHREYWKRNLRLTAGLLAVWFLVSFGVSFYARELSAWTFLGFPLPFYVGAQGAPITYVLIIWFYAWRMNRYDREYGVDEKAR